MLSPALVAAILAAVLVHARHRQLVVAIQVDPASEPVRRRQLMFETWVLTGPSLALLLAANSPLG